MYENVHEEIKSSSGKQKVTLTGACNNSSAGSSCYIWLFYDTVMEFDNKNTNRNICEHIKTTLYTFTQTYHFDLLFYECVCVCSGGEGVPDNCWATEILRLVALVSL